MTMIPDYTENEVWIVRTALRERYGKDVEPEQVDIEMRLNPFSSQLTSCPALFWSELGANFVIAKTSEHSYRPQFFYRVHQQFGTGVEEYSDLTQCVVTLLQVQADHAMKEAADGGK